MEKKKYLSIEDIPGVGPATASKLREVGFSTVESLAMATINELVKAGIGEKVATKVIEEARSSISVQFIRADELLEIRKNIARLTTGCTLLDEMLGGGVETQTITELYGEFGVGKSVLCHQLSVYVQLPLEKGGLNGSALYIDTEQTFRPEWIFKIAKRVELDPKKVLQKILVAEAYNSDHQMLLLEHADKEIEKNNVRLIIVDSLMAHFRSEYLGREMLAPRQQMLNKHLHRLLRLARAFNAAAVVTNQVMARPDMYLGLGVSPTGGHVVAHASHTRLFIRKAKGSVRIVRLVSSPYLPEQERAVKITDNGFEDVLEEE